MSPYRETATCGAVRRHYEDSLCQQTAGHRGLHRDRLGRQWRNWDKRAPRTRYLPPHLREEAVSRAENYAAYGANFEN